MTLKHEITTISEKGQVVVPQSLRKELGIKPRTKFLVFGRGNIVILKRLELPDVEEEWEGIFRMMDEKGLRFSEKEILEEVAVSRRERRRRGK
jgi:AbrB family looped-hinge helix DNA binding protein